MAGDLEGHRLRVGGSSRAELEDLARGARRPRALRRGIPGALDVGREIALRKLPLDALDRRQSIERAARAQFAQEGIAQIGQHVA